MEPARDGGTAHAVVVDENRMIVSITSTTNLVWGSGCAGTTTGIMYNDQMDDFSNPAAVNAWGAPPSIPNYIQPGKRPLSSMTPTIVYNTDGNPMLAIGGAGGTRIITGVLLSILNVLDFGMNIEESAYVGRYHDQLMPDQIDYETRTRDLYIQQLIHMGYTVRVYRVQ